MYAYNVFSKKNSEYKLIRFMLLILWMILRHFVFNDHEPVYLMGKYYN